MRSFPFYSLALLLTLGFMQVSCATANSADVIMDGYKFNPKHIEIKAGETVKWTNKAGTAHTVSSGTDCQVDEMFESGILMPEKFKKRSTFEHTFDKPGTYPYFCRPHCGDYDMKGEVVVK